MLNDNASLPWAKTSTWLRFLIIASTLTALSGFVVGVALFALQTQVLASPTVPAGPFVHMVEFKGRTYYLAQNLFRIWSDLNIAFPTLIVFAVLFGAPANFFSGQMKKRLWDDQLSKMIGSMDLEPRSPLDPGRHERAGPEEPRIQEKASEKEITGSILLTCPHPYDECLSRLYLAVGSSIVYGRAGVRRGNFSFITCPRDGLRNSFRPSLFVKLVKRGQETGVSCRFGLAPSIWVFLTVWFGGIAYAAFFALQNVGHKAALLTICVAMAAGGLAFVAMLRSLAVGDRDELLTFVKTHLDIH